MNLSYHICKKGLDSYDVEISVGGGTEGFSMLNTYQEETVKKLMETLGTSFPEGADDIIGSIEDSSKIDEVINFVTEGYEDSTQPQEQVYGEGTEESNVEKPFVTEEKFPVTVYETGTMDEAALEPETVIEVDPVAESDDLGKGDYV